MCPEDILVLSTAISLAIAKDRSTEELDLLGAIFTQIGDNLALFSAQCSFNDSCCESNSDSNSDPTLNSDS